MKQLEVGDIVMYGAAVTMCNAPTQKIGVVIEAIPAYNSAHISKVQWFDNGLIRPIVTDDNRRFLRLHCPQDGAKAR